MSGVRVCRWKGTALCGRFFGGPTEASRCAWIIDVPMFLFRFLGPSPQPRVGPGGRNRRWKTNVFAFLGPALGPRLGGGGRTRREINYARPDAPVFSHDGNRARAASVLTNVDCSWPVGVCMPVEARLVRDSIRPTSVDLTVSTLLI